MKKLFAILLVACFASAFIACGGGSNKEAETTEEPAQEETVQPMEEEAPAMDTTSVETDTTATP